MLCLTGAVATAALTAEPAGRPNSPARKPTPRAVGCREIVDYIEQVRAKAEQERQEILDPSAPAAHRGKITITSVAVPAECDGLVEEHGLRSR
ncbi:hypothetical protein [Streptomyces flaveolus]|uniref:hypothetical protein n=1 Tax=Streptomyces flaveolus TaxID=67297 RepID=UPI00381AA2E2